MAGSELSYELIWIDQGTPNRTHFKQLYRFHKEFVFPKPMGYPISFNLAFRTCTREYIFVLEEDWLIVNMSFPWLSFSIDLLAHAPESMYGILLRREPMDAELSKTPLQSCLIPSGTVWAFHRRPFHFTNGPTVYRMSSIQRILTKYNYSGELAFALGARELGYTLSFWADGVTPPKAVPMRFLHIGKRSTGAQHSTCVASKKI
jgi:hypothetical protein